MPHRQARRTLPELLAETLAARGRLAQSDDGGGVPETGTVRQGVILRELHGAGDRRTHRDGVHAGAIAGVVGLDDGAQVADPTVGAKRPDSLVLRTLT